MSEGNEGNYCKICGGLPPSETKQIVVEGKPTGIDRLDEIIKSVRRLDLHDEAAIIEALLERTRVYNYVPTRKTAAYGQGLFEAYLE
ncbi:putative aldolase [Methanosphaerula palustris E1-9c]|uniref:Putative aldolase n=2 Tax=Methanosphaerula palustris TaxID=475088 RepID=B8GGM8_METPE|nr:putative aldolase [Methanosphaerula palustris E1-9c]